MSKYNLSNILSEYIGGGRIGTLKISFKDLQDKMDELDASGKVIVREKGASADGKVNREFEVVDRDSAVPGGNKQERGFTVYDFKFGFDPGDEDKFMNEYPFSVGGNDIKLAMELIDGVEEFRIGENLDEQMYIDDDEFEMEMGRSKKDSLKKEMMIHVDQLIDGNIDMNDFMNVVEDIMAEVKSLKEEVIKKPIKLKDALERYSFGEILDTAAEFYEEDDEKDIALLARQTADKFRKMLDDFDGGVGKMKESTGPSDKAETEDDVVNVDKVAGPGAKGRNYGAETSANTAEDDQEDKEIQNPRPMYENGDVDDFANELKEASSEESIANYIIDYYRNPKTGKSIIDDDIVMAYFKTHPDYDERFDGTEEGMKDGLDDFQEFLLANYDIPGAGEMDEAKEMEKLKEQFKRFM